MKYPTNETELLALPEQSLGDNVKVKFDPATGFSYQEREPVQFLVNRSDIYAYHLSDGSHWTVGETADGKMFRMRLDL